MPILASALLALIASLAPPKSQGAFTAAFDLSENAATSPQVALDAEGDALVVWRGYEGSRWRIEARARSATGALGPVQALSLPAEVAQHAERPQVALNAAGDAVVVWQRDDGTTQCGGYPGCKRVQIRARSAAGTLGPVQTLSGPGRNAFDPQVGVDADGDALTVWWGGDGTSSSCCARIHGRARSAAGTLGPVHTLSAEGQTAFDPQVAMNPAGRALAVWARFDGSSSGCCARIQGRARSAAGTLGGTLTLSPGGRTASRPQVAIDADGDALVVWQRHEAPKWRIEARTRSAAGALGPAQMLSAVSQGAAAPQVAVDADGDALVVWWRSDEGNQQILARARSAAGAVGPVEALSATGQGINEPQVGMDADGDAVAVWQRFDHAPPPPCCRRIRARARSADGILGPVQTLSTGHRAGHPQIAVDPGGNALAVWERFEGGSSWIQGAAGP